MKWLILIALISCGQKSPPAKDVGDSDGDQIPNYLERSSELEKYVAEVIPFPRTTGNFTFKLDNRYVSVKIGNEHDIAGNAMKLLTKTLSTLKTEDHFSEWSLLKTETNSFQIPDGNYDVTLALETSEKPGFISLTDGKAEVEIGSFSRRIEFRVSGEELRQILSGKLHLNMKRATEEIPYSVESTVRDRTYRVFYFDGRLSRIHYVSHELEFAKYLKLAGITDSHELKNFRGFSQNDNSQVWWTRSIGEKDKIVVKASLKSLSEFHYSNFKKSEVVIDRKNGSPAKVHTVNKGTNSRFILKVRGTRTRNIFKDNTRSWHQGGARGEISEDCREWSRRVSSVENESVTKAQILSSLVIQKDGKTTYLNDALADVTESVDEKGWYLELAMDETPEEFTILLASLPEKSFVKTGVYKTMCTHFRAPKYGGVSTNEEGQMSLQLESFIEKID